MKTGSGPRAPNSLAARLGAPEACSGNTKRSLCEDGSTSRNRTKLSNRLCLPCHPQAAPDASFTNLVDGDGEGGFDVGLHVFLPVVAEKTCSLENGKHFGPTVGVGAQLLRRGREREAVAFGATEGGKKRERETRRKRRES